MPLSTHIRRVRCIENPSERIPRGTLRHFCLTSKHVRGHKMITSRIHSVSPDLQSAGLTPCRCKGPSTMHIICVLNASDQICVLIAHPCASNKGILLCLARRRPSLIALSTNSMFSNSVFTKEQRIEHLLTLSHTSCKFQKAWPNAPLNRARVNRPPPRYVQRHIIRTSRTAQVRRHASAHDEIIRARCTCRGANLAFLGASTVGPISKLS